MNEPHMAILYKTGKTYRADYVDGGTLAESEDRGYVVAMVIDRVSVLFIDSSFKKKAQT